MSYVIDKIQKLENNVILLLDASDNIIHTIAVDSVIGLLNDKDIVVYGKGKTTSIDATQVTRTEIFGEAEKTGLVFTQQTLAVELTTNFLVG